MKHATVADLRNRFRRVSAWIENGEDVEILRRGKPFARLAPAGAFFRPGSPQVDFRAQRSTLWGKKVFSKRAVQTMQAAELKGEEG